MGRAPCCEKLRVKSGPWTPEEDNILVAHIQRFGHGNWRALPKQAGLSRCGKSCRLRWVNYLRPDIKRGNFTREEEDAVIQLHQLLGNRWSAIAARLPGRTDNEIKNVWHTHLKKRLVQKGATQVHKTNAARHRSVEGRSTAPVSSEQSFSSSATEYSMASSIENVDAGSTPYGAKEGTLTSEELQIDDSFWSETLPMTIDSSASVQTGDHFGANGSSSSATAAADEMDFWLRVFMQAGDMQDLMQI